MSYTSLNLHLISAFCCGTRSHGSDDDDDDDNKSTIMSKMVMKKYTIILYN